jgi:potassium-transporting ATPase KdpC subunit
MKAILQSVRALLVFTLLTGAIYPLIVTLLGRMAFADKAGGSLIVAEGQVAGSALLAQKTDGARYFWPRPSAADFATVASGASNKGPTSADLVKAVDERRTKFGADSPPEMLTASGSGLDPHISPAAARQQVARIATERKLPAEQIIALVVKHTEPPQWGVFGEPRVNVLILNRALDALR